GHAEEPVQSLFRHLGEDALLEFDEEPRNRNEDDWPRTSQVLEEGLDSLCEKKMTREPERDGLAPGAFQDVRQREIRQDALSDLEAEQIGYRLGVVRESAESVGDALRSAGRSRGVDDGGQLLRGAGGALVERRGGFDQRVPPDGAGCVCIRQRDPG